MLNVILVMQFYNCSDSRVDTVEYCKSYCKNAQKVFALIYIQSYIFRITNIFRFHIIISCLEIIANVHTHVEHSVLNYVTNTQHCNIVPQTCNIGASLKH